jgi:hypothetical protein
VWALAAVALPILVRGRAPVLDALGALIWAAGLITAMRLAAGEAGEPPGLLLAALVAAAVATVLARRMRPEPRLSAPTAGDTGTGAAI